MYHDATELARQLGNLALDLGPTPSEAAFVWTRLNPQTAYAHLPPLSIRLETLMWSYLEERLDAQGEAEFFELASLEPQIFEYLQCIVATFATPLSTLDLTASITSTLPLNPETKVDFVVMIGRDGRLSSGGEFRHDTRSFAVARSGLDEETSAFEREHPTNFGVIRVIVDRDDDSCRVNFVFENTLQDASQIIVEWRDVYDEVVDSQVPRYGAVQFESIDPGVHQFVFLDSSSGGRELDRIRMELKQE